MRASEQGLDMKVPSNPSSITTGQHRKPGYWPITPKRAGGSVLWLIQSLCRGREQERWHKEGKQTQCIFHGHSLDPAAGILNSQHGVHVLAQRLLVQTPSPQNRFLKAGLWAQWESSREGGRLYRL